MGGISLVTRRQFCPLLAGALVMPVRAHGLAHPQAIVLPVNASDFTPSFVEPVLDTIAELVQNLRQSMVLQFQTLAQETRSITMAFAANGNKPYLVLQNEKRELLRLIHHGKQPLHHINFFAADSGILERLQRMQEKMRQLWARAKEHIKNDDPVTLSIKL